MRKGAMKQMGGGKSGSQHGMKTGAGGTGGKKSSNGNTRTKQVTDRYK